MSRPEYEEYVHHRDYMRPKHKKWDHVNQGEHQAYCPDCRRIVVWVPLRGSIDKKKN